MRMLIRILMLCFAVINSPNAATPPGPRLKNLGVLGGLHRVSKKVLA